MARGVNPPGQPWRIDDLRAEVKADGSITVDGRALLLASGSNIGTTANLKVFATLICEAVAPFTKHSTNADGVPLGPERYEASMKQIDRSEPGGSDVVVP